MRGSIFFTVTFFLVPFMTLAYPQNAARSVTRNSFLQPIFEPTCRAPYRDDDYVAKHQRNDELSICENVPQSSLEVLRRQTADTSTDDYSCSESKPCANGACCSKKTGYCNYGPDACGPDLGHNPSPNAVCWSNCNAVAECGKYALPAGKTCPLNVCCSEFGFVSIARSKTWWEDRLR
jgi:chitinase